MPGSLAMLAKFLMLYGRYNFLNRLRRIGHRCVYCGKPCHEFLRAKQVCCWVLGGQGLERSQQGEEGRREGQGRAGCDATAFAAFTATHQICQCLHFAQSYPCPKPPPPYPLGCSSTGCACPRSSRCGGGA